VLADFSMCINKYQQQAMILASIWFATKTCQTLTFGLQIYGNVFAQFLACQIFSMANYGCQPMKGPNG
jgi:hypothetical protein